MKSEWRSGVSERDGRSDQPRTRRGAHAPGIARMTAVDVLAKCRRAGRRDGRLGGRRHGGGNRSISQIPVRAIWEGTMRKRTALVGTMGVLLGTVVLLSIVSLSVGIQVAEARQPRGTYHFVYSQTCVASPEGFNPDLTPIGTGQWAFTESGFGRITFHRDGSGTIQGTARSVNLNNFSGFEGTFSCDFDNNDVNCTFPFDGGTGTVSFPGNTIQVVEHGRMVLHTGKMAPQHVTVPVNGGTGTFSFDRLCADTAISNK